jgi:hypothetical protein
MGIAGGLWRVETSVGRRRTCPRSRLPAAGRAKARWTRRSESSISTPSASCRSWFEKQPERAVATLGRRGRSGPTCARRPTRRVRNAGPSAPRRRAIPIAAQHLQVRSSRPRRLADRRPVSLL